MKTRISQLIVRFCGYVGVGITAGHAEELAAVIIAAATVAVDLFLHRKQHGDVLGGSSVTQQEHDNG